MDLLPIGWSDITTTKLLFLSPPPSKVSREKKLMYNIKGRCIIPTSCCTFLIGEIRLAACTDLSISHPPFVFYQHFGLFFHLVGSRPSEFLVRLKRRGGGKRYHRVTFVHEHLSNLARKHLLTRLTCFLDQVVC